MGAQVGSVLALGQESVAQGVADSSSLGKFSSGPAPQRVFNGTYQNSTLDHVAFPLGGMGAGMVCLEGTGAISKFSLRHRPDLSTHHLAFTAISLSSPQVARVLEGPVPTWKLRPRFPGDWTCSPDSGLGFPRFREATFEARFPFATVRLKDEELPLEVELTGWSPFAPGDADNASLPVAGIEYRLINKSATAIDGVFSFHAENFLAAAPDPFSTEKPLDRIRETSGGFVLYGPGATAQRPWDDGYCAVWVDDLLAKVNHVWRLDGKTLWKDIESGKGYTHDPLLDESSPGASIFVPFHLAANESKTIVLHLAWYVPESDLFQPYFQRTPDHGIERVARGAQTYQPWYAGRFKSIEEVKIYWHDHYRLLRSATEIFTRTLYDSTVPPEVMEAVAANLTILKSPTVLRQTDGRLWGWEGCGDEMGSCYGSSNHVWNYAQAIAHLFPDLERGLRETELLSNLSSDGFQVIRATLPITPIGEARRDAYGSHAAADGQLGTIVKLYRDWRVSGDTPWMQRLWPQARLSLDYCIRTWDPMHRGSIEEAHLTTYDGMLYGADSLCTGLYIGALRAATLMGKALGENVDNYSRLLSRAQRTLEKDLFNGEYFFQRVDSRHLHPHFDSEYWTSQVGDSPEILALTREEGPPCQYGQGCLSDGVLGAWLCWASGTGEIIDQRKVESHLRSVHRYNLKRSVADHPSQPRATFACGEEAGLLVCSWPRGGRPTFPTNYVDEVWTGIEYQVASHLISCGKIEEGLEIVRSCRSRYDGRVRNPFGEVEAGHWYARAMSSYALLQAFSGARYDAVDKVLYLRPAFVGDFRSFLSTATGFGTVGVKNGQPFVEVVSGRIPYREIQYVPATGGPSTRA